MTTTTPAPIPAPDEDAVRRLWDENRRGATFAWDIIGDDTRATILAVACALQDLTHPDGGWEPLGRDDDLRVDDEARYVDGILTRSGVVADFDSNGNPFTTETLIGLRDRGTWFVRRAPVTWYRLPAKPTEHLTDVTSADDNTCAYMARGKGGDWIGVSQQGHTCAWPTHYIATCTLDGLPLTRDGDFEDGEPRFREITPAEREEG